MTGNNKQILEQANAAITEGDYEGFLSFCTEDTQWTFVGEVTLNGKQAVREYMARVYTDPPRFRVEHLIADGDFVTAVGMITMKNQYGKAVEYSYCDIWRLREGKLHELKAFVIADQT